MKPWVTAGDPRFYIPIQDTVPLLREIDCFIIITLLFSKNFIDIMCIFLNYCV